MSMREVPVSKACGFLIQHIIERNKEEQRHMSNVGQLLQDFLVHVLWTLTAASCNAVCYDW